MSKYLYKDQPLENLVSVSQLTSFMKCENAWRYGYIDRLKRRIERTFLTIGSLCHAGMEGAFKELYDYQIDIESSMPSHDLMTECIRAGYTSILEKYQGYMKEHVIMEDELPEFQQRLADARVIFKKAFLRFQPEKWHVMEILTDEGELIPAIELHYHLPIEKEEFSIVSGMHGFIDLIAKDKETGQIWVIDYKFVKQLGGEEDEAFNLQNAVYTAAASALGIPVTGTITYKHKNMVPKKPKVNKNGTISKAAVTSDWETYSLTCIENDQNPEDYEDMREKLAETRWSQIIREYRSDETLERMLEEVVLPTALRIDGCLNLQRRGYDQVYIKSMYPFNCKMCTFAELCQSDLRGYDSEYLLTSMYISRDEETEIAEDAGERDHEFAIANIESIQSEVITGGN